MKACLYIILTLNMVVSTVHCQEISKSTYGYPSLSTAYMKSYLKDGWSLVKAPGSWKSKQWVTLGISAIVTGVLIRYDSELKDYIDLRRTAFADDIVKYGLEPWGSGWYSATLLGGMYVGGRYFKNDRLSATALTAGKAAIITSVFVQGAKQLAHRHRPGQDSVPDPLNWDGPFSSFSFTSFPSGHSALAFSIASVLAAEYSETVWVPVISYAIASGTALSRMYSGRHWASDVLAGAVFGYACGRFLWKSNRKIEVIPISMHGFTGCRLVYSFSFCRK